MFLFLFLFFSLCLSSGEGPESGSTAGELGVAGLARLADLEQIRGCNRALLFEQWRGKFGHHTFDASHLPVWAARRRVTTTVARLPIRCRTKQSVAKLLTSLKLLLDLSSGARTQDSQKLEERASLWRSLLRSWALKRPSDIFLGWAQDE